VAASEAATARTAEANNHKQKEATASADSPEPDALSDLFPGRQSCRISSPVAPVIPGSGWRKKGANNETGHPISKQIALQKELQTKKWNPNPSGDEVDVYFSTGGFRTETKIRNV
jgi:hypothetical protein